MNIHHIGIAVDDSKKAVNEYVMLNRCVDGEGVIKIEEEYISTQNVLISMIHLKSGLLIEFVQPANDKSPIWNLSKQKAGIYHICYEVDDIFVAISSLKKYGRILFEPCVGYQKRLFTFFAMPQNMFGVSLFEIIERKRAERNDNE